MKARLFLSLFAAAAFAQDYLPLETGNQWIYRQAAGRIEAEAWTIEVGAPRSIDGREYFSVSGFPGRNPLLLRNSDAALVFYDPAERRERPWADFSAPLNQTFASDIDACNREAVIAARQTEKVALGEFPDAVTIRYRPACADAGLTEEIFVPGLGLAKRTYTTIAGPQTMELVYARVAGFSVYSQGEHSFHLTLDGTVYQRNAPITARLTLRNTTGQPLRLVFLGNQNFDIVIRNEAGQQVWRWSDGKAFTRELRPVEVTGERNWVENIQLDLPAGNYTATGSLAVLDVKYESTLSFRVEPAR